MSLMEKAHAAFVEEDYDTAIKLYTDVLQKDEGKDDNENEAIALASRAAAYLKVQKNQEALEDAAQACVLKPDYEVAYYRKGVAAFSLSSYRTAKDAFEKGLALSSRDTSGRKYHTWLRKCEAELTDDDIGDEKANGCAVPVVTAASPSSSTSAPQSPSPSLRAPSPSIRYQYYQTEVYITVTILQKGVKEEEADISITARHLKVVVKDITVLDGPLFDAVVPEESNTKFLATKVEIKLKKAAAYQWKDVLASQASAVSAANSSEPLPSASSMASASSSSSSSNTKTKTPRPYASHRDWEKIEKDIDEELSKEKPQGEEALNKLFQEIYAKGSDETRRAMVKSFQTSGGTALSTNWDEVAKKDYEKERSAPEGMEFVDWK